MTTIVGDANALKAEQAFSLDKTSATKRTTDSAVVNQFTTSDYLTERAFYVPIGPGGLIAALTALDKQLLAVTTFTLRVIHGLMFFKSGRASILSKKQPVSWTGYELQPGQLGVINHGGSPKLLTKPGRYPPFPFRNWWARTFESKHGISDTVISAFGLTVVQVSQNQAAVVSDPQNQIFVIKNSGFVAFAVEGSYDVLSIVDQTHLSTPVIDRTTNITLGWTQEIKMRSKVGNGGHNEYVVALFLNIPANNCAILQRGDDLELLGAGQNVITNPSVTLRGLFTRGECQLELPTKDIFTRDQVPVSLRLYLKWELVEPLKLTTHGYNTPYDALRDKTQSILTQIVSHLDYSSMVKQRTLGPNNLEDSNDASSQFLDSLRTQAMDEMHEAALEYGIILKDLAVIDRQFKGEIASTMDKLTTRALHTQVEAANVDRENQNRVKQEEGALAVARIKAQSQNALADSEAYSVVAAARAQAEKTKIEAEAQAHATRMAAEAEAEAIQTKAAAAGKVVDAFAREMELRRMEVLKVRSYGSKTVFAPLDGAGRDLSASMATGMAAAMGAERR
ncbi:Band 7 domain-containing protein [Mycena kentingensis (nom. inval.)]|nr:Band 7 domain-containing protein [Mycena kentingensis (nom. inval.)]